MLISTADRPPNVVSFSSSVLSPEILSSETHFDRSLLVPRARGRVVFHSYQSAQRGQYTTDGETREEHVAGVLEPQNS